MNKLSTDIANITGISKFALDTLTDRACACICHNVLESTLAKENLTEIDIGIGILYIKCEEDKVRYKFVPSNKMEEAITSTLVNKESPVALKLELSLKNRIENAYKDLL